MSFVIVITDFPVLTSTSFLLFTTPLYVQLHLSDEHERGWMWGEDGMWSVNKGTHATLLPAHLPEPGSVMKWKPSAQLPLSPHPAS